MKISRISVTGFRGIDSFSAGLAPGVNVLIGRNGSGKSTLIHAVVKALSFIFANKLSLGKDFISAGNNTLNVRGFKPSDFHFDRVSKQYAPLAVIDAEASFSGELFFWEMRQRNNGSSALMSSGYAEAFRKFIAMAMREDAQWPLLAYYSDSYPHVYNRLPSVTARIIKRESVPRNYGYYKWDDESACTSLWETRLCDSVLRFQALDNILMHSMEGSEEEVSCRRLIGPLSREIEYISETLNAFLQELPLLAEEGYLLAYAMPQRVGSQQRVQLVFRNGERNFLHELPAGYRRLISIVLDLAYRAFLLNEGAPSPHGIAIIDEIDLHLHPSLQQHVLQALQKTFPYLQFIVSTHSAAVIGNLDTTGGENGEARNSVLIMHPGVSEPEIVPNLVGVDYNAIIRDFMDTPSRNEQISRLKDDYFSFLNLGMKVESDSVLSRLTRILGENSPALREIREKGREYEIH